MVTQHVDIPLSAIVGAELNSFGFYALDVFSGRATNFDWVADDLNYGKPQLRRLQANPQRATRLILR
jgi:hypothetical protein